MARTKSAVFHFKQFSVAHDRCAMKVGTDGVLLGAWAQTQNVHHVLDIGTGSGVIALMMAQRTSPLTRIDGIELNLADAQQAQENVDQSPWKNKVKIIPTSIQDFSTDQRYDHIVSNPPFFDDSLPPANHRATARHTQSLSFGTFLEKVNTLLSTDGRLSVILPFQEGLEFMTLASTQHLYLSRKMAVYSKPGKKQERWLLEFTREPIIPETAQLYIHQKTGEWSTDYQNLTRAFYLKF